jgi:hypothetical protein
MSLSKVIEIARGELGYTESPPGSNRTKYGEAYGMNGQPWCVMALWYWFREAGEAAAFFGGAKTASCGTLLRWYREQGLTVPVEQVQAGDIVILNFHGTKDTEHCGLVVENGSKYDPASVKTIEGNTNADYRPSTESNGGMVCEKTRYPSQIVAVCRPQYKEEPVTVDDITGHWAEKAIRRCIERGLLKGYPDGSFGPDRPVTRAELAVILDRLDKEDDGK